MYIRTRNSRIDILLYRFCLKYFETSHLGAESKMDSIKDQLCALSVTFSQKDEMRTINLVHRWPQVVHEWRGRNGGNALHEAVMRDWQTLTRLLVQKSHFSDLMHHKDRTNATPLITAFKKKNTVTAKFLLDNGAAGHSPLIWAWNNNYIAFAKYLIDCKSYLDCCDMDGMTPLLCAVTRQDPQNVRKLLLAGVYPEPIHKNYMTPLIWAVQTGQSAVVQLLLEVARPPISRENISGAREVARAMNSPHFIVRYLDLALEERHRLARTSASRKE